MCCTYVKFTSLINTQSQLLEVRGQLDEVRGHLNESHVRETRTLKDMAKLEGQLSEKTSLVGHLEAELGELRKTVDQAKTREQKLTREVQQVHVHVCERSIGLSSCTVVNPKP